MQNPAPRWGIVALGALACAARAQPCAPQWQTFAGGDIPSGAVYALAVYDDGGGPALYMAGSFNQYGSDLSAPSCNNIVKWTGRDWALVGTGVSGTVRALAVFDEAGGPVLLAGGTFGSAGGAPAANIARWNGQAWSAVGGGVNAGVHALCIHDGGSGPALIAGGEFTTAASGSVPARRIARWDGQAWSALGQGIQAANLTGVRALASAAGGPAAGLYAAGDFAVSAGAPGDRIARWDGQGWLPVGGGLNNAAYALAAHDDGTGPALFAGGSFTTAGGTSAGGVARWDGQAWSAVGSLSPGLSAVRALRVFDDGSGAALYAAGDFVLPGGLFRVARWSNGAWSAVAGGLGAFSPSGGVYSLAQFDEGRGPALFAGGAFAQEGWPARIAKWSGQAWTAPGTGMNGSVSGAAVHDDGSGPALYLGGAFASAGDVRASIVRRAGGAWSAVAPPLGTSGPAPQVRALATFDDGTGPALYAGFQGAMLNGVAMSAARWNGVAWTDVSAGLGSSAEVWALAAFDAGAGPALYAGGLLPGTVRRWNGQAWEATGGVGGIRARTLAVFDGGSGPALYAGIEGGSASLHRWDGQAWTAIGGGGIVSALAVHDDGAGPALYLGGDFVQFSGVPGTARIARWDGVAISAVGSGLIGTSVSRLASFDDGSGPALYAGGPGLGAAGVPGAPGLLKWDGQAWSAVGGGIGASPNTVTMLTPFVEQGRPGLYVGGSFVTVGTNPRQSSLRIARWGCPAPAPCYPNCDNSTQPPVLNVQDFSCFLTRYAAGESYANCDGSTQAPVLNVQDFSCFLTRYAAGCP